jgi:dTDP-glucose 4,6-dehydratase
MKIVITGAAGFIGTNLVNYYVARSIRTVGIAALDKLGFGSGGRPEVPFLYTNLQNLSDFPGVFDDVDVVINLAAETHVDRSLSNYQRFFDSNVRGTSSLLEALSPYPDIKLVHISTDEIYGPSRGEAFTEESRPNPCNPYSGTKAAAEMLVTAWMNQYKRKVVICRLSNVFGPYQYPEKFIPKTIISMLEDKTIPVYGDGKQTREWLYVGDACRAIDACVNHGELTSFNFSSGWETQNIEIVNTIANHLGIEPKIEHVPDRPGHDNGYKMSNLRAKEVLGWEPEGTLGHRIRMTTNWFVNNHPWWEAILTKNPKLLSKQPWNEKWT